MTRTFTFSRIFVAIAWNVCAFAKEDASQISFSELEAQAVELVEKGSLQDAEPLLMELIKRVEATDNTTIQLDLPYFYTALAHFQNYAESNQKSELESSLTWLSRLVEKYPESSRLKEALLQKITVLRILGKSKEAIDLMVGIISKKYAVQLSIPEEIQILKDLTQTYYNSPTWLEGLKVYRKLLAMARTAEDKNYAAAALFEAYIAEKKLDEALDLLPIIAQDSLVRYLPRLNISLLKASDLMSASARLNDAAVMLSLLKTTPQMLAYHKKLHAKNQQALEVQKKLVKDPEKTQKIEQALQQGRHTIKILGQLPSLENELQVRRARNYTQTARRYESFWMYHGLMTENPKSDQIEFYTYACFSNAIQIQKINTAIEIGRGYKKSYPRGQYIQDMIPALVSVMARSGDKAYEDEYLKLAFDFIWANANDPASINLLNVWASLHIQNSKYTILTEQHKRWLSRFEEPLIEDGLYYWMGIAEMQQGNYEDAYTSFDQFTQKFPESLFYPNAFLNKGSALFYAQKYTEAKDILEDFLKLFPDENSIDQAHYFLGEIANIELDLDRAIEHFKLADQSTKSQAIHDGAAFGIGRIYEARGEQTQRLEHYQRYIQRFGQKGRLSDATIEVGDAYLALGQPNAMLKLYREHITRYTSDAGMASVDTIIESYTEIYLAEKTQLDATIAFFEKLKKDPEFHHTVTSDRGFLFEHFYYNKSIDPTLYNRLRNHPSFNASLSANLEEIKDITQAYYTQHKNFHPESPATYFRKKLKDYQLSGDRLAATRMLMGLYRCGERIRPNKAFDVDFVQTLTPRLLLYVADYAKSNQIGLAESAWLTLLNNYPDDDAAVVAHLRMATVEEDRKNLKAALEHLETIENTFSDSPQLPAVILRQGDLLTQMRENSAAREKYTYILKVPDWRGEAHARALYQTGQSYFAEAKFAEAHGYYERTFLAYSQFSAWSARAYLADAEALIAMGSKADALKTLEEALTMLPKTIDAPVLESIKLKIRELQLDPSPTSQS